MTIAQHAIAALATSKEPVHVDVLAERLRLRGVGQGAKDPIRLVYGSLRDYTTRHPDSPIAMLPGRAFILKTFLKPEMVEAAEAKKATRNEGDRVIPTKKPGKFTHLNVVKTCGNCSEIEYSGANEVTLNHGFCNAWRVSGNQCVYSKQESCSYWEPRTEAKMKSEREDAELLAAVCRGDTAAIDKLKRKRPDESKTQKAKIAAFRAKQVKRQN